MRLLGAAFAGAGAVACTSILGLDPLREGPTVDGGGGGERRAEEDAAVCGPDTIDAAGRPPSQERGDDAPRFFALRSIDLEVGPGVGLDLDHVQTTGAETNSCVPPRIDSDVADPASGVDNAIAGLLPTVSLVAKELSSDKINERLRAGYSGMVLGIGGWNGTPTDDVLTVLVYPTLGIYTETETGDLEPGGPTNPLRRKIEGEGDPTDLWMPDARFPTGGVASQSTAAWANDGKLVARFSRLIVPIRSDLDLRLIDLVLEDAWITADLSFGTGDPRSATLKDGLFAGRLVASQFLGELLVLYTGDGYPCDNPTVLNLAVSLICSARDIRSGHCDDGKGLACDAVSAAGKFETYAVDGLGAPFEQTRELYESADLLPPDQRCKGVDLDAGTRCPER